MVSTARTLADNLAVLRLIEDRSLSAHVVGIAMGEEGLLSRVLGPRAGAAFTFAAAAEGAETAPGQVSARTLLDLYRIEQLDQATRIFGVAGNPIAPFAFAADAQHGLPARKRERRDAAAQGAGAGRPADTWCASCPSTGWP